MLYGKPLHLVLQNRLVSSSLLPKHLQDLIGIDIIRSAHQFGENWHFLTLNLPVHNYDKALHLLRSSIMLFSEVL